MDNRRRTTGVKPGRAPSFLGGIGSVVAILFGVFWTAMAFSMTRDSPFGGAGLFPLFGVLFIILGIANAVYNFRQATQKNRYSVLDITDSQSEPDPLNERFGLPTDRYAQGKGQTAPRNLRDRYCPYCGRETGEGFAFCPSCGKELPPATGI